MPGNVSINLARKRKKNYVDQFISWSLTIGRLIVILTEVLALSAFIYRFGLDRQLVNLHDRIVQEQAIVSFLKKNETTYRNLQDRLSLAQKVTAAQDNNIQIYDEVKSLIPTDFDVQNFTFSLDSIKITAATSSVASLGDFVNAVKNNSEVSSVSIDDIENRTGYSTIQISLTIYLKTNQAKNL